MTVTTETLEGLLNQTHDLREIIESASAYSGHAQELADNAESSAQEASSNAQDAESNAQEASSAAQEAMERADGAIGVIDVISARIADLLKVQEDEEVALSDDNKDILIHTLTAKLRINIQSAVADYIYGAVVEEIINEAVNGAFHELEERNKNRAVINSVREGSN